MRLLSLFCAAAALAVSPAFAQSAPASGAGGDKDKAKSVEEIHADELNKAAAAGWNGAPVDERTVSTRHSAAVDGRTFPYTATAGTLTIRDDAGKPTASTGTHASCCWRVCATAASRRRQSTAQGIGTRRGRMSTAVR